MSCDTIFSVDMLTDKAWQAILAAEFKQDYFKKLTEFYRARVQDGVQIYPPTEQIFSAFNLTGLRDTKIVVLGQDPYHQPGQAMGLSFSVPDGVRPPPSLRNIFKELQSDLDIAERPSGNLTAWAQQGVLLLNSALTVEAGQAGSHSGKGWERFTDAAINAVSRETQNTVFLLWGVSAIAKRSLIDEARHLILTAPHPSPLSAYRGFFGCRHFSQANAYLTADGRAAINW